MPEIAEVETVRNTLKGQILNKKITNINIAISIQHLLFLSFLKHISTCGSII